MANVISYKNDAFPKDQEFGLFGMFLVKNGEDYTLTDEDESRFEQNFGVKFADWGKPDPDDTTVEGYEAPKTETKPQNTVIGGIVNTGGEK